MTNTNPTIARTFAPADAETLPPQVTADIIARNLLQFDMKLRDRARRAIKWTSERYFDDSTEQPATGTRRA